MADIPISGLVGGVISFIPISKDPLADSALILGTFAPCDAWLSEAKGILFTSDCDVAVYFGSGSIAELHRRLKDKIPAGVPCVAWSISKSNFFDILTMESVFLVSVLTKEETERINQYPLGLDAPNYPLHKAYRCMYDPSLCVKCLIGKQLDFEHFKSAKAGLIWKQLLSILNSQKEASDISATAEGTLSVSGISATAGGDQSVSTSPKESLPASVMPHLRFSPEARLASIAGRQASEDTTAHIVKPKASRFASRF